MDLLKRVLILLLKLPLIFVSYARRWHSTRQQHYQNGIDMSEEPIEVEPEEPSPVESDLDQLMEYDRNLHVITLVYDVEADSMPSLDLGKTSPWLAITLLQTAIETLQVLIPPVDITYNGRVVCQSEFTMLDDEPEEEEDLGEQ